MESGDSKLYYEGYDKKMRKVGEGDLNALDSKIDTEKAALNAEIDTLKENIEKVVNALKAASFEGSTVPDLSWVDAVYSVTNTLTKCSTSNPVVRVSRGGSYSSLLTPDEGYTFSSISGTMGGTALPTTGTSSFVKDSTTVEGAKEVLIPNVTGNLVIVATAESNE